MSEEKVLSVYTDKLKEVIEAIPEELYLLSPEALQKRVNPRLKMYELKRSFWEELFFAQENNRKMRLWRVYEGKYTKQHFFQRIMQKQDLMAWITSPLTTYEDKTKAALDKVTERYSELINMEITTTKRVKGEDGEYMVIQETCPKKALVLLQTIKNLEDRIKGTAVQRQISLHSGQPSGPGVKSASLDMEAVNERLEELEEKLGGSDGIKVIESNSVSNDEQADTGSDNGQTEGTQKSDVVDAEWRDVPAKTDEESRRPSPD